MQLSADYVTSEYPNCRIFMLGDANVLKIEQINRALALKQLVKKPTTKGDTMLDLIFSNLHEFYREPVPGAPLGGSYHFTLELNPLHKIRIEYKTTTVTSRPISDEGLLKFDNWISQVSWVEIYKAELKFKFKH